MAFVSSGKTRSLSSEPLAVVNRTVTSKKKSSAHLVLAVPFLVSVFWKIRVLLSCSLLHLVFPGFVGDLPYRVFLDGLHAAFSDDGLLVVADFLLHKGNGGGRLRTCGGKILV